VWDEDGVTRRDRREQLDRTIGCPVDVLVREAWTGRPVRHDVVVDLLELGLGLAFLVVLVRGVRTPVAAGRQHLDRDEAIGLELESRGEVADLARACPRAAQLHGDIRSRHVAHWEARLRSRRRYGETATAGARNLDITAGRDINEVARPGPHALTTFEMVRLPIRGHVEGSRERQHDHLVAGGLERQTSARRECRGAHPNELPARGLRREDDGPAAVGERTGRSVQRGCGGGHAGLRSGFGTSASATWWSSSW
jgi:hypothetical protein